MKALRTALSGLALFLALARFASALTPAAQAAAAQAGDGSAGGTELSFPTRILPILTKAGCNAGACHGAAIGQGGFKLSLLGYDPQSDYDAITRQFGARRVDFSTPGQSLLLRK